LSHSAEHLFGREEELDGLDTAWVNPKTRVLSLVAWGGVGKSSLISHWMAQVAQDDWRFAERVFDWSFFSQGARDQGAASADTFIAAGLEFFGDSTLALSMLLLGRRDSESHNCLRKNAHFWCSTDWNPCSTPLVRWPASSKDPALVALLRGLAQRNPGLCIVTTRERLADLDAFRETTAPEWTLQHLSPPAGVELLRALGVQGTESEFQQVVEGVAGHALTLNLLGRYLAKAHRGDIRRRDLVNSRKRTPRFRAGMLSRPWRPTRNGSQTRAKNFCARSPCCV